VPSTADAVSVVGSRVVHHPCWVGVLAHREGRRVVVVDGTTGRLDDHLGAVLTAHLAHVVAALPGASRGRPRRP
jgi:hypothetical protein